jgi:hypothetical protein
MRLLILAHILSVIFLCTLSIFDMYANKYNYSKNKEINPFSARYTRYDKEIKIWL